MLDLGAPSTATLKLGQALAHVRHHNIVVVHDVVRVVHPRHETEVDAMVMEHVDGHTLAELKSAPMTRERARLIGVGIIEGIAALHAANRAHGDLHEEQIVVAADGPRVIDLAPHVAGDSTRFARKLAYQQADDLRDVRRLLTDLIEQSGGLELGDAFRRGLPNSGWTLSELRNAFELALSTGSNQRNRE
jgi:RIO-like serine/threonine protein kinase